MGDNLYYTSIPPCRACIVDAILRIVRICIPFLLYSRIGPAIAFESSPPPFPWGAPGRCKCHVDVGVNEKQMGSHSASPLSVSTTLGSPWQPWGWVGEESCTISLTKSGGGRTFFSIHFFLRFEA
ncbi:hypothetical protein CEXT_424781 [Caerostris extrusa]|uniref:Uncharacterized protein n=1 Tax=Caerostris extrusa TaxID=172846 RepID=A0AAV4XZW6_CAEEX|nr:hypothetical protein CEXT_424781 [Caerostris extrusa]